MCGVGGTTMDMRNRLMSGLASIVLGSVGYMAQGCTPKLSVKTNGSYVICDTTENYNREHVCFEPVMAYIVTHPATSSSSSEKERSSSPWESAWARRMEAKAESKANGEKGVWVCPKK